MNRKTSIFLTALLAGLMAARSANAEGRIEGSPVIVEGGAIVGKWAANAAVRAYLGIPFAAFADRRLKVEIAAAGDALAGGPPRSRLWSTR
jgi:hypothetical protein